MKSDIITKKLIFFGIRKDLVLILIDIPRMDDNKLYYYAKNNILTDAEIILDDGICIHTMFVHKAILASKCEYFEKLFLFEANRNEKIFRLTVPHALITKDIIDSYYGININETINCQYLLNKLKCLDYLCCKLDVSMIYDLVVPNDEFELLLEITNFFDLANNYKLLQTVKKNLPSDYDLLKFPPELVELLGNKFLIITCSKDRNIKIWDSNGQWINTLQGHRDDVKSIVISPDQKKIISCSIDQLIKIWDLNKGTCLHTISNYTFTPSIAISCSGKELVTNGRNFSGTTNLLDVDTGRILANFYRCHINIISVQIAPLGDKIISGNTAGTIDIYDSKTERCLHSIETGNGACKKLLIFDEHKLLALFDSNIKLIDIPTATILDEICYDKIIYAVAISNNNDIIATAHLGMIKLWCMNRKEIVKIFNIARNKITALSFSPDDSLIVFGASSKESTVTEIRILDLNTGDYSTKVGSHSYRITDIACVPN